MGVISNSNLVPMDRSCNRTLLAADVLDAFQPLQKPHGHSCHESERNLGDARPVSLDSASVLRHGGIAHGFGDGIVSKLVDRVDERHRSHSACRSHSERGTNAG